MAIHERMSGTSCPCGSPPSGSEACPEARLLRPPVSTRPAGPGSAPPAAGAAPPVGAVAPGGAGGGGAVGVGDGVEVGGVGGGGGGARGGGVGVAAAGGNWVVVGIAELGTQVHG